VQRVTTLLPAVPARRDTPTGEAGRRLRRLTALAVLTAGVLLRLPAAAQEPPLLAGTWAGTWWMGKYEEPVELALTQSRKELAGHVTLWAYPRTGSPGGAATVRAPVTGTLDGHRVQLSWTMPEHGQFSVELTFLSRDHLFGLGGVGPVTTGFELRRPR
jgi:hypothetical protein